MDVLSIQSRVAYGHVGNSTAIPVLQRLGHQAWPVETTLLSNHLGYPTHSGRVLPPEEVAWLSRWATGGLRPDLVVLLDIDPAIGLARAARRSHADRLEAESLAFHQRVRQAFLDLAAADQDRYLVVDATQPVDVIAFTVRDRIHRMLPPAPAVPSAATGSATPLAPTVEPGSWAAFDSIGPDGSPIVVGAAGAARHRAPDDPVPPPPTDALPPEVSPAEIEAATAAAVDAAVTDVDLPLRSSTADSRWR